MKLFQDNTKSMSGLENLSNQFSHDYFTQMYRQIYYSRYYEFHFSKGGRNKILTPDYTKEVEKHLTEINYLGI